MAEHLLCKERVRSSSLLVSTNSSGTIRSGRIRSCARPHSPITEDSGWTPGRPNLQGAVSRRLRGRSSSRLRMSPSVDLLIRDLQAWSSPTSGPLDRRPRPVARRAGSTLTTGMSCSAVNRSSISPSQDKDTIPMDPVRDWPPGQMLEGVKLQRARGGCLGAKSR